jgi:diadenosine tetraphosphatase ApaH/serine/threonine PP2A family protein phosphatase/Ca2+-binding EF-hand superfamily protein
MEAYLVDSWAQLDIKEEAELRNTNEFFDQLKKHVESGTETQEEKKFQEELTMRLQAEAKQKQKTETKDNNSTTTLSILDDVKNPISLRWIEEMIEQFRSGRFLQLENVKYLITRVEPLLRAEPNCNMITLRAQSRLTIVGDLHGQFDDFLTILYLHGYPNERHPWIFNGDFVDRGQNSAECLVSLLAFKLLYPNTVFLNRGNHEARDLNSRDGFEREIVRKYNSATFDQFSELFACLPLCCIVDETLFVVHGGLFYDDIKLQDIHDFDRFHQIPPQETLMEDMLWSDPCDQPGRFENNRGCACEFGPDVVDRFFQMNHPLNMIIRSHEMVMDGYAQWFGGKLYTVFSCSNYQGTVGNDGAYCTIEKGCPPRFNRYRSSNGLGANPSQKHALLKEDIVSKLLSRIAASRLGLVSKFSFLDENKSGRVSRQQWCQVLQEVLGLSIDFIQFQSYLGLPEMGVDGLQHGAIDYMDFCNRYIVYNPSVAAAPQASSTNHFFEEMMEVLFARRYELDSVFRFFDTNGDGMISREEFRTGLTSLATVLKKTFTSAQIVEIIDAVDTDGNGYIDYNEFFSKFQTQDCRLLSQERMATQANKRTNTGATFTQEHVEVVDTASPQAGIALGANYGRTKKIPLQRVSRSRLAKTIKKVIMVRQFKKEKTNS